MEKTVHQGRNVKRFREMLGIKQDALALDLGLTQQAVSSLEQKEIIDERILADVAALLKVPVEAIKHFDEEKAINIIGNTVNEVNDTATGQIFQFNPTFNPLDKLLESFEENKKLYERLLKAEQEKVALLEKLLEMK